MSTSPSSTVELLLLHCLALPGLQAGCHLVCNLVRKRLPSLWRQLRLLLYHRPYHRSRTHPRRRPCRLCRHPHQPSPRLLRSLHYLRGHNSVPRLNLWQAQHPLSRRSHHSPRACRPSPRASMGLNNHQHGQRSLRSRHPPPPHSPRSHLPKLCKRNRVLHLSPCLLRRTRTPGYHPHPARPSLPPYSQPR